MYGGTYCIPETIGSLREELNKSYKRTGLTVIEVQTNRKDNSIWHRNKWRAIHEDILNTGW